MRTFLDSAAAMFRRCAFLILLTLAFQGQARAGAEAAGTGTPQATPPKTESLVELRAKLDEGDQIIALRALQLALNRVGDGGTFIWQKKSRQLKGVIRPTSAFRNADGQVCRHVIYALMLGRYMKQIEGVACRLADGRWSL